MSEQRIRILDQGELPTLESMLASLGLSQDALGRVSLEGDDLLIRSPHRLTEAVSTAQLLIGSAATAIWHRRTGVETDLSVNTVDALHSLHASHFVWQQGAYLEVGAEHVPVNGFYRTRDDRQVLLCAGPPYMKLLNGYLNFLGCGNSRKAVEAAVARYAADELEDALAGLGIPGCRAFSREEWLAHPQGRRLAETPVVEIEKIADGEPEPFIENPRFPLDGLRVMDFTHVLAGPRSTQSLAELGAEVLHISSPLHPDTLPQHLGVDMGKYCAYLELEMPDHLQRMHDLVAHADVFATSYRGAVNSRFDLSPQAIAARSRKGIVALTVNAYGHAGPWAERVGFDPNGQAASGFAASEGDGWRHPRLSPVFYLADLMSGYFAAAGMMAALLRRATEGGSYHVKVSLARSAMWVQELGLVHPDATAGLPVSDTYPHRSATAHTAFGEVSTLANPVRYTGLPLPRNERLVPYGADAPRWQTVA
jgi:crotonobetainyl-CoA:carnitine CoA-transferase CaiB-like acyl-CoA transferase